MLQYKQPPKKKKKIKNPEAEMVKIYNELIYCYIYKLENNITKENYFQTN